MPEMTQWWQEPRIGPMRIARSGKRRLAIVLRKAGGSILERFEPALAYRLGTPSIEIVPEAAVSAAGYNSQIGQDILLDRHVFFGRRGGVFVDVGAHDGVTFNNTYFLERERSWTGVCVEPNRNIFPKLESARQASCINAAVGPVPGTMAFRVITGNAEMLSGLESAYKKRNRRRISRETSRSGAEYSIEPVLVKRLDAILNELGINQVDFLSIDVEGGEEGVLDSIQLSTFGIEAVIVENNYRSWSIARRMQDQGYQLMARLGWDELYMRAPVNLLRIDPTA